MRGEVRIRKGEKGIVRLPKILVLIMWRAVRMKGGGNKHDAARHWAASLALWSSHCMPCELKVDRRNVADSADSFASV